MVEVFSFVLIAMSAERRVGPTLELGSPLANQVSVSDRLFQQILCD